MTAAAEHLGAFRCPRCGNDGSRGGLRYLEDIVCSRAIVGVDAGRLQIDGYYDTEGYDDGERPRFACISHYVAPDGSLKYCGHEWPAPAWVLDLIDWV